MRRKQVDCLEGGNKWYGNRSKALFIRLLVARATFPFLQLQFLAHNKLQIRLKDNHQKENENKSLKKNIITYRKVQDKGEIQLISAGENRLSHIEAVENETIYELRKLF